MRADFGPWTLIRRGIVLGMIATMLLAPRAIAADEPHKITRADINKVAHEIYIYGYPLVTMEMTRRVMTNTDVPKDAHAPMGQFYHSRTYPNASFRDVTAPNADTLYSTAWLHLTKEPYILSLPEQKDRYYLVPLLDAWTNVFQVPGTRTTGDKAQKYAITGPGWTGKLPEGVTEYKSPTNMVWILGRTYCTGTPEDYNAVHALQDQYLLVSLSAYGKPGYSPPNGLVDPKIDMKTAVREQVNAMGAEEYYSLLAALMKDNPPANEDAPMLEKMAKIGLAPGKEWEYKKIDPSVANMFEPAMRRARMQILAQVRYAGKPVNNWELSTKTGKYGTDYDQRAYVAMIGLGANLPQDAVYPVANMSTDGRQLTGENKYVVHFPSKNDLPPVKGFWSLTMYNGAMFFVDNPLNRYTLSQRDDLKTNSDGSIDLYIQKDSPGKEKESNWLPAPEKNIALMLRLYWPKETPPSIIDGSWKPPGVQRMKQ